MKGTIAIILVGVLCLGAAIGVSVGAAKWAPLRDERISAVPSPKPNKALMTALAGFEASIDKQNVVQRVVAPDGRKVAVYHRQTPSKFSVTLIDSSRTAPISPVDADLDVGSIAWRPDSKALAVVAWTQGAAGSTIWQYDAGSGRLSRRLAAFDRQLAYALAWDRQGNTLAALVADEAHTGDRLHGNLVLVDKSGAVRQLTSDHAAVSPSWAPSGTQIAVGNETLVGRPGSHSGINIFDVGVGDVRFESTSQRAGVAPDLQIDRVIWKTERTIFVRFSVFRGSDAPADNVQWYEVVLQ
jgi:hypothetical protein